jgi:phosphinothricin acetyltransferase
MEYSIDKMVSDDWGQVRSIYLDGIATGNATFEAESPGWDDWDSSHIQECRLVARAGNTILGWAGLSPVSSRCVYSGVAEISVYVATKYQRIGVGGKLLAALIEASENNGIWTLQAGIFPENIDSINLHKRYGFRDVGRMEKLSKMTYGPHKGAWRDVILLERRSKSVGID